MAYVEYLAMKKEIEEFLSAGYRISAIYRELVARKKISMSYQSFSRYVSGRYRRDKQAVMPDIAKFRTSRELKEQKNKLSGTSSSTDSNNNKFPDKQNLPAPIHNGTITISQPDVSEILKGDIDVDYLINGRK